jgi:glutaredoxin 3
MPDIKIYSTAVCPYCVAAKNFLKQRGQSWEEIRVDLDPAVRKEIVEKTGRTSVPQIFINGQHIGGFDDMVALDRAGGLASLLEAGA